MNEQLYHWQYNKFLYVQYVMLLTCRQGRGMRRRHNWRREKNSILSEGQNKSICIHGDKGNKATNEITLHYFKCVLSFLSSCLLNRYFFYKRCEQEGLRQVTKLKTVFILFYIFSQTKCNCIHYSCSVYAFITKKTMFQMCYTRWWRRVARVRLSFF